MMMMMMMMMLHLSSRQGWDRPDALEALSGTSDASLYIITLKSMPGTWQTAAAPASLACSLGYISTAVRSATGYVHGGLTPGCI